MNVESPDVPLERARGGQKIWFETATVTLSGILPPGFSGPVGTAVQDLFRPLVVIVEPGEYSLLLSGQRYRAADAPSLVIEETSALTVGGFVAVWLENFTSVPQPFRLRLRGHSGREVRRFDPTRSSPRSSQSTEVGSSSVWLGMAAAKEDDRASAAGSEDESLEELVQTTKETRALDVDP